MEVKKDLVPHNTDEGEDFHTSFLDLIFNMALFFAMVFMIALLSASAAREEQKDVGIKPRAELLIVITWPSDQPADVDSYLADPANGIVMFQRRQDGLMFLDHDDLGDSSDEVTLPDGNKVKSNVNQETITVRGLITGEYVLNVHLYNAKTATPPVKVTVEIFKIEPTVRSIFRKEVELKDSGDEVTVTRFTVLPDKSLSDFNDLTKRLTARRQASAPASPWR